MRFGVTAALAALLLLSACGKGDKPAADAAAPAPTPVAASTQCDSLPDFAPLYAGAVVSGCFKGASTVRENHDSGTAIYAAKATPAEVLAWYKQETAAKGLAPSLASDTMFSARDGEKRTVMILTAAKDGGTQVTVNWGRDTGA